MEQSPTSKVIRGVFEGGGVKGSGLVGAVEVTERRGYTFSHVAGTSAGAIVAALIAAGYRAAEMRQLLETLDYKKFRDPGMLSAIPLVGQHLNLLLLKGLYKGEYVTEWIRGLLAQKGIRTFRDLIVPGYEDDPILRYRLSVVASDVTRGEQLTLPREAKKFGIDPDDLDVASAIRMSISIPFFYEPVVQKGTDGVKYHIVDGGILSNYPVWLFDQSTEPNVPTIGYKLVEPDEGKPRTIYGPITLFLALFATMMEAHDAEYIENENFMRTVPIKTYGVRATDFDIGLEKKRMLYESGIKGAEQFFSTWDEEAFQAYVCKKEESRRKELWESAHEVTDQK